jgi:hypothetical protein
MKTISIWFAVAILAVAGCSTNEHKPTVFDDESGTLAERQERVHETYREQTVDDLRGYKYLESNETPLVDNSKAHIPYVSGRSEPVRDPLPRAFSQSVDFRPRAAVPFADIVQLISSTSGYRVHVRSDVYSSGEEEAETAAPPVDLGGDSEGSGGRGAMTIDGVGYEGTLEGFLNFVTSSLNLVWSYNADEREILVSRFITKDYRLMTAALSLSDTGVAGENVMWADSVTAIGSFLSPGGSINSNDNFGLITVTDTRDVQDQVTRYVRRLNLTLARSIQLKFDSVTVRVNEDQLDGLMANITGSDGNISASLFGQEVISNSGGGAAFSVINPTALLAGTELVGSRMRGLASADQRRTQIVRTQNNHPVHFNDLEVTQYLGQVSRPEEAEDSTGESASTGTGDLSLSELETGYKLRAIPHITDDNSAVVLDVWMEVSQLRRLRDETSGGQRVQAPEYVTRTYDERLIIPNGGVGLVAAQEIMDSSREDQGVFGGALAWLGGSKQRQMTREITLIMVTPVISNSNIVEQVF